MGPWSLSAAKTHGNWPVPQIRHLRSAPITEAIFDFRVKAANDFHAEDFISLNPILSERFPKIIEARGGQVTIGFKPGAPDVTTQDFGLQGYFFTTEDEKLTAQFRIDGFTLNRLAPYTSWDELFPIAKELWEQYRDVATPQAVTRLAIRYINRIPHPGPEINFEDYLRAGPVIPAELPQTTPAFLLQVQIYDAERDVAANVIQRLEASLAEQKYTVILDIDAFKAVDLAPDDPSIQLSFEQLRSFKNMIFFNYLTEEAVRRFE
jgi:uncharacterized protein (TIGR04255 family)